MSKLWTSLRVPLSPEEAALVQSRVDLIGTSSAQALREAVAILQQMPRGHVSPVWPGSAERSVEVSMTVEMREWVKGYANDFCLTLPDVIKSALPVAKRVWSEEAKVRELTMWSLARFGLLRSALV